MAEVEPALRRSSRSTRGKHSRFSRDDEITTISYPKKESEQPLEEEASKETTENADGVVSCICNKVYENDEQMMAQCEKCDQWQHVKCLFGKEDEGLLPDKYYCPSCAPELYPSITPSAPISISIPTTPTTPTTTITITTPEALPVTPGEHDTESSSNNNNPENSPVKVDEANSPPNKKRKVVPATTPLPLVVKISDITDYVRKSVATAFFTIFSKNIVPVAVLNKDLEIHPPGTVEGFAERLSVKLEQALYEKFALNKDQVSSNKKAGAKTKDVGPKYRTKFRSLSVILKDDKNPELHRRIVTGELSPEEFVILSRDELMNPALKLMAEAVRAESIRNSILKVDDGPRIRRTHKGEEYIEDAFEEQAEQQEWRSTANEEPTTTERESSTDNQDHKDDTNKPEGSKENSPAIMAPQEPIFNNINNMNDTNDTNYDYNEADSQQDNGMNIEDDDDLDEILNGGGKNSTSISKKAETVNENENDDEYDPFLMPVETQPTASPISTSHDAVIFTGQVTMATVSEFPGTAIHLSGPLGVDPYNLWSRVIDATVPLVIDGRLNRDVAAKYLQAVGQSKDIVSFVMRSDESGNKRQFNKLYDYFRQKDKCGVIVRSKPGRSAHGGAQIMVKDAYLLTLQEGDLVPDYLWLTSQESQLRLESYLQTDKRVIIGLFVLANRIADLPEMSRGTPSIPPSTTTVPASHSSSDLSSGINTTTTTTDPQALLSLLAQMNSGPASQFPSSLQKSYPQQQYPSQEYYSENDDDYEP